MSSDLPKYLVDIIENLRLDISNDVSLYCRIVEPKEKGFLVKIKGLFAYLPYSQMPWFYSEIDCWHHIGKHLKDRVFKCSVESIQTNPQVAIKLNAKNHEFHNLNLDIGEKYIGIIIKKTAYGFLFDVGYQFKWSSGSCIGILHLKEIGDSDIYDYLNEGDEIVATYQGVHKNGKHVFGKELKNRDFISGEIDHLIGTIQEVQIRVHDNEKKQFFVLGNYPGRIPITKAYYPKNKSLVKNFLQGLHDGDVIKCEILKISRDYNSFDLKLDLGSSIK